MSSKRNHNVDLVENKTDSMLKKLYQFFTDPTTSPSSAVYISFIISMTLSIFFVNYNDYQNVLHQQQKFNTSIIELKLKIHERLVRYLNLSKSAAGLMIADQTVNFEMWNNYIKSILDKDSYPGIMGLAYIHSVTDLERSSFLNEMSTTYPNLKFKFDDTCPQQLIVKYVLPEQYHTHELNSYKALGLNMCHMKNMITTMTKAQQTNQPCVTSGTKLIPSDLTHSKPVIVIFTPIYKKMFNYGSRYNYFLGWISLPIEVKTFFSELITPSMRVRVKDQDVIIFESNLDAKICQHNHYDFTYSFAGRDWTIDVDFAHDDQNNYYFSDSTVIGCCGFILSVLLAGLLWALVANRKRAQALAEAVSLNLQHTQNRNLTILENVPGAVFRCAANINWKMEYISHYIEQLTGYSSETFINGDLSLAELVHPDDLTIVEEAVGTSPIPGHSYYVEYRIIHANGSVRWLNERGIVIDDQIINSHYLTGVIFDITDDKLKDKDVRRMTLALQNTVEGIVFIDPNLNYIKINQSFSLMMGFKDQEVIGNKWLDSILIDDRQALVYQLSTLLAHMKLTMIVRGLHTNGSIIHQHIVIVSTYDDDDQLEGYYCFIRDITQAKLEEQALSNAVAEAQRANNMKSEFLAIVSHELRTPLNAIIGYSEMLIEEIDVADTGTMSQDLDKIATAGKHLLHLINDILDVSKLEAGKMTLHLEDFAILPMVKDTIDIILPTCKQNNNKIEYHCAEDIGNMFSDFTKIRQSIMNLLGNATKFTKDGNLYVTVAPIMKNNQEHILFSVTDTGVGMTPEQIKKIFRPFTQADSSTTRQFGGTGLGLTITKQFCELLDGNIEVISIPGQGSTFTIILPRIAVRKF